MKKRIVIVGANHSGISAAVYMAKHPEFSVTLLEASDNISFVGAEALLWIAGIVKDEKHLGYTTPEKLRSKGIDLRLNSQVEELDFENHQVRTAAAHTVTPDQVFDYDYLVLATGSRAFRPEIINSHGKYVQTMKDLADGKALKKLASDSKVKTVAVIGGGYIGIETAEALTKAGKKVTIYHSGSQLLTGFYDTEIVELLQNRLTEKGVKLVLGSRVNNIDDIEADAFLFSLGFRPNSELGGDKIERLAKVNCYKVDQFQRTSVQNVYAIGDCASSLNNVTGEPAYFALGSNTATTALVCAHHILGIDTPNLGRQGANAIEIFDLKLCSVGFTLEVAQTHGFNALSNTCSDRVKQDDFTTNNDPVTISVVYDQTTHRLLGVQIASFTDVSPILHMFSLAIQEGLTLERIKYSDMFFHPTLNKLYNFVIRVLHQF